MPKVQTISASWVAPVVSPPIRDGIISFEGERLRYVGPTDGRSIDEHFENAIVLPGLVNAHTHLDLTGASGKTPPKRPFTDWLQSVIDYRRNHSDAANDISMGAKQCLEFGTTLVGDIAGAGHPLRLSVDLPLRSIFFFELIGLSKTRCEDALQRWQVAGPIPASPHAPYSICKAAIAAACAGPMLAIHLAESLEERELLSDRTGPFVAFLESQGAWFPDGLVNSWDHALHLISKSPSPLIIHGNYLTTDHSIPRHGTIVFCPRTHAAFGHPPHPFRDFLADGLRVVLGTDSLASNPNLSLLAEARFVANRYPDFDESTLLHMVTDWSASALGFADRCGSLASGQFSDFCVVELPSTHDPLRALFAEETPVRAVYVAGVRVV